LSDPRDSARNLLLPANCSTARRAGEGSGCGAFRTRATREGGKTPPQATGRVDPDCRPDVRESARAVIVDDAGGGISRIDADCEALAGGGVFPRECGGEIDGML